MLGPTLTLTLALLAAAPAAPAASPSPSVPEDVTLAAPPFETHGFSKKDKDIAFYSEHFAQRLTANGVQVITTQQISSVREMDKLRQLAGCPATSADCIIELGHMLGAQGVVRGTLAKVGETFQVDVRVYQASDGKVVAARSASARSSEALIRALDQLALETAGLVKAAFAPKPPPPPPGDGVKPPLPPPPPPKVAEKSLDLRAFAWAPSVAGLATGIGGLGCLLFAGYERSQLVGGEPFYAQAQQDYQKGKLFNGIGIGLLAGSGLAVLVAGGFYLLGAPHAAVSVAPAPGGVKVEVRFP